VNHLQRIIAPRRKPAPEIKTGRLAELHRGEPETPCADWVSLRN